MKMFSKLGILGFVLSVGSQVSLASSVIDYEAAQVCAVTAYESMPYLNGTPDLGAVAHTYPWLDGSARELATIQNLIDDQLIYLQNPDQTWVDGYYWLYSGRLPLLGTPTWNGDQYTEVYGAYSIIGQITLTLVKNLDEEATSVSYRKETGELLMELRCDPVSAKI